MLGLCRTSSVESHFMTTLPRDRSALAASCTSSPEFRALSRAAQNVAHNSAHHTPARLTSCAKAWCASGKRKGHEELRQIRRPARGTQARRSRVDRGESGTYTPSREFNSKGCATMSMTMTEQILARAAGKDVAVPGDNIWVNVDVLMTHDVCGPGTFGVFYQHFGKDAKVWDREKVVIIPDHYIFTHDAMANRNVAVLREFAQKQKIKYFYDVGTPRYKGVCHIAMPEEGHTRPGEVLLGTDSHTCTAGAFGEFATGIGNTDAGFVLGTGKLWLKVPPTMRFVFTGKMPPYLMAKDLILAVIGDIGCDGATYRAMEFDGDAVYALNIEERMTLCNMVIEAGGKNGVIAPDKVTLDYVNARNAGNKPYTVVKPQAGAKYDFEKTYDVSKLEPVIAKPHSPDNRAYVSEVKGTKLDRAYIGSCTGGKPTDFMAAAQ